MILKTVELEWQVFAAHVLKGVPASEVQKTEMKRSFFAGAFCMLKNLQRIGEPDISEADGIRYMEDRMVELEKFYSDMFRDYAEKN